MDSADFRRIMAHWVTGVSVVTTRTPDGKPCGLTASAVCSVSLDPLLVLVCVEKDADTHDCIRANQSFAINMLRGDAESVARRFAASEISRKFDGLEFRDEQTGSPILADALAWVDCSLHAEHDGGDHTIFVGAVLAGDVNAGDPLLYFRSGYGRLAP